MKKIILTIALCYFLPALTVAEDRKMRNSSPNASVMAGKHMMNNNPNASVMEGRHMMNDNPYSPHAKKNSGVTKTHTPAYSVIKYKK